ncbi:MAG: ABC transporter permease [Rhodospirillales bacterium]|nr:ABC transporter permease [Rhodospirillales bacterium]
MITIDRGGNWLGLWTLYWREVRRFVKVYNQTVVAPVVTTLLFLAIFALALGHTAGAQDATYLQFLAPGLVMMAITQNSFANTSSSIIIAKVQGNIVDTLMPPLTAFELTLAMAMGGATRGLAVGIVASLSVSIFLPVRIHDVGALLYFAFTASLMLSLLGLAGGIWADKFDHIAAVTNFIVVPLSFLSGTFYSVERLPPFFQAVAHLNPFFYMIDGFRYGWTGRADMNTTLGMAVVAASCIGLWILCHRMFATGYKLKA